MSTRVRISILADENTGGRVVKALREEGYGVVSVNQQFPGIRDTDVLRIAHEEQRLILTQDKDFGELAVRLSFPASLGVLPIRIGRGLPHDNAERLVAVIRSRADWSGHFSVVDEDRVRMRPLPRKNIIGTPLSDLPSRMRRYRENRNATAVTSRSP